MQRTFNVTLAEGLKAVVYPPDPAYSLCQQLSSAGYNDLHLTLSSLMTGTVEIPIKILDIEMGSVLTLASTVNQLTSIPGVHPHHWVLSSPSDGNVTHWCKICGSLKIVPAEPVYKSWNSTNRFNSVVPTGTWLSVEDYLDFRFTKPETREAWLYDYIS